MPARIALIGTNFQAAANMRSFDPGDIAGLRAFAPEALVLPLNEALALADAKMRGRIDLPSLGVAIVVLTSLGWSLNSAIGAALEDEPLGGHHRDLLWGAFGLPVFEQLRGWDGAVIARECEVHDGLHFDRTAVRAEIGGGQLIVMGKPTGFAAEIAPAYCECGKETPRLRNMEIERSRAAAAAA